MIFNETRLNVYDTVHPVPPFFKPLILLAFLEGALPPHLVPLFALAASRKGAPNHQDAPGTPGGTGYTVTSTFTHHPFPSFLPSFLLLVDERESYIEIAMLA